MSGTYSEKEIYCGEGVGKTSALYVETDGDGLRSLRFITDDGCECTSALISAAEVIRLQAALVKWLSTFR